MIPSFLPYLALLTPSLTFAADAPQAPAGELAGNLGQIILALVVVLAVLFACLWAIKRLSVPRGSAGMLKVLGAAAVGPRERVVLVEIGSQVLVLGVAPGNVRTLHVLEAGDLPLAPQPAATSADFSSWLKKSLDRRNERS